MTDNLSKALRICADMMRRADYRTDEHGVEAAMLDEAADEIERLRGESVSHQNEISELMLISRMQGVHDAKAEIARLKAENARLREWGKMPDAQRRAWMLSELMDTRGYFNRRDLTAGFGVSVQQASLDIRDWLKLHPSAARYNTITKRYERAREALEGMG